MDKFIKNENVDHIYCNKVSGAERLPYSEKSNFIGDDKTVKKMKNFILSNINLIEELQNQLQERDQLIAKLLQENESLKQRLQRYKHSKGSSKKSDISKEANNNTNNSYNNNNNVPVNKNKTEKSQKDDCLPHKDKRASIDTSEDESCNKKRSEDSQESISIKLSNKNLFLMTNKEYRINDWKTYNIESEDFNKSFDEDINLEIPRWVETDLPSPAGDFEIIEDVSDEMFQKRHLKYEADERRRKKWDQQRIREQKNIERLKKRHLKEEYAEMMINNNKIQKTMSSFFPDVKTIKFIQISDDLPISAFGEQIPKLAPKDFSLPWLPESDQDNDNSNIYSIDNICSNGTPRMKVRTKFISRCSNSLAK
jgi:PEHE domain